MEDAALLLLAAQTIAASLNTPGLDLTQGVGGFNPDTQPPGGVGMPIAAKVVAASFVAAGTYTFKLQDSPDNATWTDISPTRALVDYGGPFPGPAEGTVMVGGYAKQPFVRMVITLGGTGPSLVLNEGIYIEPLVAHLA